MLDPEPPQLGFVPLQCRNGFVALHRLLMDVKERASAILGRKADIMTRDSLHKVLRSRIESSALQVF